MNDDLPVHTIILRAIILVYLVLFIGGLMSAGYLLTDILALKPIPLIGLLKYLLLCVLFVILLTNVLKAVTLKADHLKRLQVSTKNFKWLFAIASVICMAAWLGLFNITSKTEIVIIPEQLAVLIALAIFCFWSDSVLQAVKTSAADSGSTTDKKEKFTDENIEA